MGQQESLVTKDQQAWLQHARLPIQAIENALEAASNSYSTRLAQVDWAMENHSDSVDKAQQESVEARVQQAKQAQQAEHDTMRARLAITAIEDALEAFKSSDSSYYVALSPLSHAFQKYRALLHPAKRDSLRTMIQEAMQAKDK